MSSIGVPSRADRASGASMSSTLANSSRCIWLVHPFRPRGSSTLLLPPTSRPHFEDPVERRLSRPSEAREAGAGHNLTQLLVAGLRAEGQPYLLGQRVRRTNQRGDTVEHPPHG